MILVYSHPWINDRDEDTGRTMTQPQDDHDHHFEPDPDKDMHYVWEDEDSWIGVVPHLCSIEGHDGAMLHILDKGLLEEMRGIGIPEFVIQAMGGAQVVIPLRLSEIEPIIEGLQKVKHYAELDAELGKKE